jgi:hypothetical protein
MFVDVAVTVAAKRSRLDPAGGAADPIACESMLSVKEAALRTVIDCIEEGKMPPAADESDAIVGLASVFFRYLLVTPHTGDFSKVLLDLARALREVVFDIPAGVGGDDDVAVYVGRVLSSHGNDPACKLWTRLHWVYGLQMVHQLHRVGILAHLLDDCGVSRPVPFVAFALTSHFFVACPHSTPGELPLLRGLHKMGTLRTSLDWKCCYDGAFGVAPLVADIVQDTVYRHCR